LQVTTIQQLETNQSSSEFIAKTFQGLEGVLAKELEQIGAKDIQILHRAVSFTGDKEIMYKANYFLRTAIKILKPIYKFKAINDVQLYNGIGGVEWDSYIDLNKTLAIDSAVSSEFFTHSQFVSLKSKDAIVDQFRKKTGKRPSVNTDDPDLRVNIHIKDDDCTILLDSSGESLHKRGYRINRDIAPLNEVLAAGMILLSGWDAKCHFIDPMCGSGTLPIEAALIAYNIPPGIYRKEYGFERWLDFDNELFSKISEEEISNIDFKHQIFASDVSSQAFQYAKTNMKNASLMNKINLTIADIENISAPEGEGIIIMNPPYGERMKMDDINQFYKKVGDKLKKDFNGYDVWILTSNKLALKNFGLHPASKFTLFNGALECKFHKYSIYQGSKKVKVIDDLQN
jgi:putative N6-adenine-specific DNA methylase